MSDTSALSKNAKKTQSIQQKPTDLKSEDLQLVAQRLSLILGHINQMPTSCISGVNIMDGFLLVALKVKGSEWELKDGSVLLDGKEVENY